MKKSLSEIAKIYGVSTHCLRYWEKEGLITFERDENNNYRQLSYKLTELITNIRIFRNLAIPIKDLKNLPNIGLDHFEDLLDKSKENLNEKLLNIQSTIDQVNAKKEILELVRELKNDPFRVEKYSIRAIRPHYYCNVESAIPFLMNPNKLTVLITDDNPTHILYGYFSDENSEDTDLLRQEDQGENLYLRGLLLVSAENMLDHNSRDFSDKARELGYAPGEIVGQYLITMFDGKLYDFYEARMKLEKP